MKTFTICFTGMSGSGKTTLAKALQKELEGTYSNLQMLDGDVLRKQFGNLFGFTKEERFKNNRVVRVLVQYLNQNGIHVILTLVAPYEEMRQKMRQSFGKGYIEVYVKCSSEECARRDVKGYYKQQKEGKLQNLSGIDDIFEVPRHSEIVINTERETVEDGVKKILRFLAENGYGL